MLRRLTLMLSILGLAGPAAANPVTVAFTNGPNCDAIGNVTLTEELGETAGGFPADETIVADSQTANTATCGLGPIPGQDWAVTIINLTSLDFVDVFFVADNGYTFGNTDGTIAGELAMRIDWLGFNKPLIHEDKNFDGVFESGETWVFLVNQFTLGSQPTPFASLGVPSVGINSNGSIVANVVPEPGTATLLGLGLVLAADRRRSRRSKR
ncbi:MAG: PEP-CTERM sorting domain-containing protein [Myxococcota bacterium]